MEHVFSINGVKICRKYKLNVFNKYNISQGRLLMNVADENNGIGKIELNQVHKIMTVKVNVKY
jgi:hypothetical protein